MNSSVTKTLLALLLALRELKIPLTTDEQELLQDVGQQLALDPDDWDFIEEELMVMIEANATLNHLYQYNKVKLDALDGQIPRKLFPSLDELEQELFGETKEVITFDGQPKGDPNSKPNEVITITSNILLTENQDRTAKQLIFLEQISDFVQNYRYFNTYFADPSNQITVPSSEPLIHGYVYILYIDISPEKKGIDQQQTPFPEQALAQIWNVQETLVLDVVVASKNFSINAPVKKLTLPRSGSSDSVQFTVKPNLFEGRGYIQVELFYRGYLLQSKKITVLIIPMVGAEIPDSLRSPQTARITFTTTDLLTNEQLALLPERVLTVDVELDQRDGSIDFRFLDRTGGNKELAFYDTTLQPTALGNAIAGIRQQLYSTLHDGYWGQVEGNMELLNTWLPKLAGVGRELYRQLLPHNQANLLADDQGEILQAILKPNTVIQVNPILGKVTIPWALLYERKVKSHLARVCDRFTEHDLDCTSCPHKNDPKYVCPHAFWGYRYSIEQLPCWTSSKHSAPIALVRQIKNNQPLQLSFNVYRDFQLWREHLPKLETVASVNILLAEEILELEHIWGEHSKVLDLVYFYCHGGVEEMPKRPYLELSDDRIDSNFLECYESNWLHHPLVFLNGCATGDYGPESYVSLIDDFLNAGASGVVGTECPVSENLAEYYAIEVFKRLFAGEPMGQSMLAVRRELLQQHYNPLGLVYSLYAAHEIALACSVLQK
ncbi:CHAT domain-containing protein [Scytonema sp. UIC 10036]|uniref:CHAT domain-containing protein n=1 Tax=Scytonema sp. UIC 10036 TaxID=2304196 RepID=UPI0012DA1890|nr:CHAT domain-containing protein [Scytonema sp. UIC 10036]MUG93165.1 CHAT domain-containing protein [Scytonema sp. UIC 10036]